MRLLSCKNLFAGATKKNASTQPQVSEILKDKVLNEKKPARQMDSLTTTDRETDCELLLAHQKKSGVGDIFVPYQSNIQACLVRALSGQIFGNTDTHSAANLAPKD
jgi:hypothetical protein